MSESSSVRKEIAVVAGPREWGDTRESWLARVTKRVPTVSFRTVRSLWYGEIQSVDHWAARDIRRAAEIIEAQQEAMAHAAKLESAIERFQRTDPDFFGAEIVRYQRLVGRLRNVDRTGD